jgi:hypothetical protein
MGGPAGYEARRIDHLNILQSTAIRLQHIAAVTGRTGAWICFGLPYF